MRVEDDITITTDTAVSKQFSYSLIVFENVVYSRFITKHFLRVYLRTSAKAYYSMLFNNASSIGAFIQRQLSSILKHSKLFF